MASETVQRRMTSEIVQITIPEWSVHTDLEPISVDGLADINTPQDCFTKDEFMEAFNEEVLSKFDNEQVIHIKKKMVNIIWQQTVMSHAQSESPLNSHMCGSLTQNCREFQRLSLLTTYHL